MIEFPVGHGTYRVWRNEMLPNVPGGSERISAQYSTSESVSLAAQVAIEVAVPTGGRILYGLIGGEYEPHDSEFVQVDLHFTSAINSFHRFLEAAPVVLEPVQAGLPASEVEGLLERLSQRLSLFPSGLVRFNLGASSSGSSPEMFYQLALIVLDLLQAPSMTDHTLKDLIDSRLRR